MLGPSAPQTMRTIYDLEHGMTVSEIGANTHSICQDVGCQALDDIVAGFAHDIHPDWRIQLSDMVDCSYDMDLDQKILMLNSHGLSPNKVFESNYFTPQIILALVEGLRMVRHVELLDGALEEYSPQSVMHIGRICMADCATQIVNAAFHMKHDGYDAPWKHLICGDMSALACKYAAIMETFLTSGMDEDMAEMQAMAVIFNDWFACEKLVFECDRDSLDLMDDMMDNDVVFGSKILANKTIACLTLLPADTVTYLQKSFVDDVTANPYYGRVQDPINHAHLVQIQNDLQSTHVNGIQFRDFALASRFFDIGDDISA